MELVLRILTMQHIRESSSDSLAMRISVWNVGFLEYIFLLNIFSATIQGLDVKDEQGNMLPGMEDYWTSKLLNMLHARELARRLQGKPSIALIINL